MGLPDENLAVLLLYSIIVGAFLGVLWDFFRIMRIAAYGKRKGRLPCPIRLPSEEKEVLRALSFRHTQKPLSFSGVTIFLSDLLFSITAAISVILLLFHLNGGEVRGFALFGAGIGFTVYYLTVGKLTVIFSDMIIKGIKKLILLFFSVTVVPLFRLLRKLSLLLFGKIYLKLRKAQTKSYLRKQLKDAAVGFHLFES